MIQSSSDRMSRLAPQSQREDLTSRLIESFKDLIAKGVLKPGVKLPAERDLARRFGVSRSSLRHALKALDMLGVITQRVGDGTYLSPDPSRILGSPLEFLLLVDGISEIEVIDTRLLVEPELAALAAGQASARDVSRIRQALDAMKSDNPDTRLVDLDIAFHESILIASGNRLAARIFSMLHRLMFVSIEVTSRHVDWKHTIGFHEPIYQAIHERKPEDARRAMIAHLNDAKDILIRAGRVPPQSELQDFPLLTRKLPEDKETAARQRTE